MSIHSRRLGAQFAHDGWFHSLQAPSATFSKEECDDESVSEHNRPVTINKMCGVWMVGIAPVAILRQFGMRAQDTAAEASPEFFCVAKPADSCPGKGADPVRFLDLLPSRTSAGSFLEIDVGWLSRVSYPPA